MIGHEIESKCVAHITEEEFVIRLGGNVDIIHFFGDDYFFNEPSDKLMQKSFFRLRSDNSRAELTSKIVLSNTITNRHEGNIKLDPGTSVEEVENLLRPTNYKFSYRLYKEGIVVYQNNLIYSYYYANNMSFIEVEVNESYSEDLDTNLNKLAHGEGLLGITPDMRLNESLCTICHPSRHNQI